MKVDCPRCDNTWDYSGSRDWAQCPKCMLMIKIVDRHPILRQKHKIDETKKEITPKVEPVKHGVNFRKIYEEMIKNPPTEEEWLEIEKRADLDNSK
jgi:hypothetical protein